MTTNIERFEKMGLVSQTPPNLGKSVPPWRYSYKDTDYWFKPYITIDMNDHLYDGILNNVLIELSNYLGISFIRESPKLDGTTFHVFNLCKEGSGKGDKLATLKELVEFYIQDVANYMNELLIKYLEQESFTNATSLLSIDSKLLANNSVAWALDLDIQDLDNLGYRLGLKKLGMRFIDYNYEEDGKKYMKSVLDNMYNYLIRSALAWIAQFKFNANTGQNGYPLDQLVWRQQQEGIKVHVGEGHQQVQVPVQQQNMNGLATGDEMNKRMNELSEKIIGIMN